MKNSFEVSGNMCDATFVSSEENIQYEYQKTHIDPERVTEVKNPALVLRFLFSNFHHI